MKKVYILTNFSQYLQSFSPIIVVRGQLEMLKKAGYEPTLVTNKGWNPPEESVFMQVENRQLTPVTIDGTAVDEDFEREVDTAYHELDEVIEDESVVLTHDLIFLPDYVKINVAARRLAAERPSITWLHWVHSATGPNKLIEERAMFGEKYKELLSEKFPNSLVVFPNSFDIPRVAHNFGYEENEVVEVPHPTDPLEGIDATVRRVYEAKGLGAYDVLMVYPLRLDRGKQAEMNVQLIGALDKIGVKSHLVVCDFQSTGDDKVVYREDLKRLATGLGCRDHVTFMSEAEPSAFMDISHKAVLDWFTLSNVFLLASKSETYSLIAQEAMLKGNLCILNHDFFPMRQIFGEKAIYRSFSSNIAFNGREDGEITTRYSPDDRSWFRDLAFNVKYWLGHDRVLAAKSWVRTKRSPDYVFKEYIEPLILRGGYDEQETEVLDNSAGVLGTGTGPVGGFGPASLPWTDGPAGHQVSPGPTVS